MGTTAGGCVGSDSDAPVPEAEPGPLTQLWETLLAADEEMGSEELFVEERVAACMAELGFDYTPVDTGLGYELVEPDAELGTREFAEQYGYGISTDPDGFLAGGREQFLADEPPADPNEEYVAAMSEAERNAYLTALWGTGVNDEAAEPGDTGDGDALTEPVDPADLGCQGRARDEVERATRWRDTPGFELAREGDVAAAERAAADRRVTEAIVDWGACMADAGYPGFEALEDPIDAFVAEVNAANEDAYAGLGVDPREDEVRAAWARLDVALARIAERETAVAVADVDCQESVGYRQTLTAVKAEFEQELYDAHRVEIEATLAAFLESQQD